MYVNKCTKCGAEFETKNPKRVICPGCLYPDRQDLSLKSYDNVLKQPDAPQDQPQQPEGSQGQFQQPRQFPPRNPGGYQAGGNQNYNSPQRRPFPQQGSFGGNQGGFQGPRPGGGYQQDGGFRRPQSGGFQGPRPGGGYQQDGGFRRPQSGGFGGNQGGGFRRPQPGGFNRGGPRRPMVQKKLLISREQVTEIEQLYREMLPLPNPDCHEVIGQKINLEPNKVFFGINLVRQKMNLPKLPYPKRKLAVSPEQLIAIQSLYSPLLPLPPIGCHKFISKQLKMDEWRVHVGIGIIRKQMDLPRWNMEREDAPAEFKNQAKTIIENEEKSK